MSSTTFDAIAAIRALEAAGLERQQAETIADQLRVAASADRGDLATKGELYRALWIQTGALVATQVAIAGFIVSMVGQMVGTGGQ